jgi:hypothetical protein
MWLEKKLLSHGDELTGRWRNLKNEELRDCTLLQV